MQLAAPKALPAEAISAAFEHSITWEDDIWRADPVDVVEVHKKARAKFSDLLEAITSGRGSNSQARILLFHGQSGAGKTHLIRALRTSTHRQGKAYFGYAQMTPDVASYADYYLRRLVNSLEKPYDPDSGNGESALARLTNKLVEDSEVLPAADLEKLRDAQLDETTLARFVLQLADDIVASPKFAELELDINIVRALLYLQRNDPRIDQRVRQYLYGRPLNELSQQAVAALDDNTGDGRAFEIIESLGKLIWSVDRAAMVFCIDQVEDLRFFNDAEERFQKAVRDLIQVANRVPTAIIIISCLGDFYDQVRGVLAQSYIDRIEKSGPVALLESRTPDEARLIIGKRLAYGASLADGGTVSDPSKFFGQEFYDEFSGLSTRRLLEHAQTRLKTKTSGELEESDPVEPGQSFISTLAAALGFAAPDASPAGGDHGSSVDFRDLWDRFQNQSEAEMPANDDDLVDVLSGALGVTKDEWGGLVKLTVNRLELADDLPAFDITIGHAAGTVQDARVFICNRPTQGGGLKRQIDRVLMSMKGKVCFMIRASDFPPNRKNQTAQAFRKFRELGGRSILVPIPDWERMITVREFQARHKSDPGFGVWVEQAKLLSGLSAMIQLLRLDLLGRAGSRIEAAAIDTGIASNPSPAEATGIDASFSPASGVPARLDGADVAADIPPAAEEEEDLPLSVILDENASNASSILAGREIGGRAKTITLNKDVLKRHAAVLGGSGSGKTTLALSLIEQLLLRGIPAVLIDRKGDLCSYANPDVWRANDNEYNERRGEREKLADSIDVAVYTPGRGSGRPISITLLPNGINELPEHEQELLANLSAAALGDMLHLKNSATHQKQSGTLSVALKILGSRFSKEVTLGDLIHLLEDEDAELTDRTQRMDPSGRIRRDLIGQLELVAASQLGAVRRRRRAASHGGTARSRTLCATGRPHTPLGHLHGLPW